MNPQQCSRLLWGLLLGFPDLNSTEDGDFAFWPRVGRLGGLGRSEGGEAATRSYQACRTFIFVKHVGPCYFERGGPS